MVRSLARRLTSHPGFKTWEAELADTVMLRNGGRRALAKARAVPRVVIGDGR